MYVACRMAPLPVTFKKPEGHFAVWNLSISHTLGNTACIIYDMFTHESQRACGLWFQAYFLKWRTSQGHSRHIHCKCGNTLETMLLQTSNRTWCIAYWIAAIPTTLSHVQDHSLLQVFQVWFFIQLCSAAVYKIWTDIARRTVPLE